MSTQLWTMMLTKCGTLTPTLAWKDLIGWLANKWIAGDLKTTSWKLSLASTVYHIWMERNHRLHNRSSNSVINVRDRVIAMVRWKMASLKGVKSTRENRNIATAWSLPASLFD